MALKKNYAALQVELDELLSLIDSIRLSPEHMAQEIFWLIRTSSDISAVSQYVAGLDTSPRALEDDASPADHRVNPAEASIEDRMLDVAEPASAETRYCDPRQLCLR